MASRNVKIRAFTDDAGAIDFEVDGVKAKHSRLKLDKGSGEHAIGFMLQDRTGQGLRFDTEDPIWIDEDGPCPPTPGISSDQLNVTGCTADRLSTVDANSGHPRELRYQLNFIADDGSRANCDPIIDNGGGVGGWTYASHTSSMEGGNEMPNNPPPPGPPQMIKLIPSGSGPTTTWMVQQNGNPPENPGQATVTIPKGTGATKFTVDIAENPAGIQFHPQTPLTVWAGPKGTPQSGIDNQILGPVLTKDGKLVFYDLNMGDPVRLSYSIHFQGNIPPVDPIIDNGGGVGGVIEPPGGGGGFAPPGGGGLENMFANINILLIGATLIALIAGFLIGRFWR